MSSDSSIRRYSGVFPDNFFIDKVLEDKAGSARAFGELRDRMIGTPSPRRSIMCERWVANSSRSTGQRASRLVTASLRLACRYGRLSGVIVFSKGPGV